MKASRAQIKTAKAVVTVEERLVAVETRLTRIEDILRQLVAAVSADKPSEQGQEAPKGRTARKRGEP